MVIFVILHKDRETLRQACEACEGSLIDFVTQINLRLYDHS